jgi:hypothetical protein
MHVAIKRIGLPDELSSLWRVGDAIKKLAPTFPRHKCRVGSVLSILCLFILIVRHYRIYALLHLGEMLSVWGVWREFWSAFLAWTETIRKKGENILLLTLKRIEKEKTR